MPGRAWQNTPRTALKALDEKFLLTSRDPLKCTILVPCCPAVSAGSVESLGDHKINRKTVTKRLSACIETMTIYTRIYTRIYTHYRFIVFFLSVCTCTSLATLVRFPSHVSPVSLVIHERVITFRVSHR